MAFWLGTTIFVLTYLAIASEKVHKTTAALLGSSLMLLFILPGPAHIAKADSKSGLPPVVEAGQTHAEATTLFDKEEKAEKMDHLDIYARYVNFNVIFTLVGMMMLVNILSGTGLFQWVAIKCAKFAKGSPIRTMVMLVLAAAFLSAFLDNVTTVLLMAPVTFIVASQLGLNPIPFLMAETFAANIGGTATLIGDPPNLIIGSVANFDFAAFLVNLAPFIVVLTVGYCVLLTLYYKKRMTVTLEHRVKIMEMDESGAITDKKKLRRGGIVMILTLIGFLLHGVLGLQPCVVAMTGAALA
ncbi:MAG: anion permease, partial [Victivallales bacterium]|nr:anion permease [Victivallales bacterium]